MEKVKKGIIKIIDIYDPIWYNDQDRIIIIRIIDMLYENIAEICIDGKEKRCLYLFWRLSVECNKLPLGWNKYSNYYWY